MQEIKFSLRVSADDYLPYYQGSVKQVQVVSWDGRTVRFPAEKLRRFLVRGGISGNFVLRCHDGGKFISIDKLS